MSLLPALPPYEALRLGTPFFVLGPLVFNSDHHGHHFGIV